MFAKQLFAFMSHRCLKENYYFIIYASKKKDVSLSGDLARIAKIFDPKAMVGTAILVVLIRA